MKTSPPLTLPPQAKLHLWRFLAAPAFLALIIVCIIDTSTMYPNSFSTPLFSDYFGTVSVQVAPLKNNIHRNSTWLAPLVEPNYTSTLISRWLAGNSTITTNISLSLPDYAELSVNDIHQFTIQALDSDGHLRRTGGDYFEVDLSSKSWKSRPVTIDHGNGTYTCILQVHHEFHGEFMLSITLLFRSYQGLKFSPKRFAFRTELRRIPVSFTISKNTTLLPDLQQCRGHDYEKSCWSGRWTRHGGNDDCVISHDGRFRCVDGNYPCEKPWCDGALGALESNGWVYSSHCSYKIYNHDSAWSCLNKRWLFFWGDSNHVDTIRNLLNFVLGMTEFHSVPRRFDTIFTNPRNSSQSVRITSVFNGHWNETGNYFGLNSLQYSYFRDLLWKYFTEDNGVPDTMVFNSGLHDGVHWRSIRAFADAAEFAASFWEEVMRDVKRRKLSVPRLFYRTTIATGGYARDLAFNPSKMEAFNNVFVEKLKNKGLLNYGGVIDEFDMTFPWHYDNRCNDGVHYGRAPAKARWRDGEVGHQYFVDLMLVHVILNAVCHG